VAGRGGDPRLVLSGGQTLHADYNPIADCGNFDNGQITLKSGAASAGCLTFQVPKGQKVVRVSYGNTVFHGNTAEWRTSLISRRAPAGHDDSTKG
jgi:hypothetical protein